MLAEEDLGEAGLGETGDLAGDVDVAEVPDGPWCPEDSQPGQPSADAEAAGPGGAGTRVARLSPDGAGQDEEIFVFGDDDDGLPAAQVAVAGATADPVKGYLKQIGKVPLLNAGQEVELACWLTVHAPEAGCVAGLRRRHIEAYKLHLAGRSEAGYLA